MLLRDPDRAAVTRTLATIHQGYVDRNVPGGRASFGIRVGQPLARRLGSLGAALTPSGALARLQRQLDRAGNPPAWPVERVVAAKGIGLFAGAGGGALMGLMLGGGSTLLFATLGGPAPGFFRPALPRHNIRGQRPG